MPEFKAAVKEVGEDGWHDLYGTETEHRERTGQQYAEVCYVTDWTGYSKNSPDYRFIAIREPLGNPQLFDVEDLPVPTMQMGDGSWYKVTAEQRQLLLPARCLKQNVTERKLLPHDGVTQNHGGMDMVTEISTVTRTELLRAIRGRYREASKRDKSRMLDEFVAIAGCHRKHAVRLLNQAGQDNSERPVPRGKRIYDEAVRQALIAVWEAADRICGKRLKAALPSMVQSLERHGHLDLDPDVRERLFSASASTIDRLLTPVREQAGSRRRVKRRKKMGSRVPVRTFTDWNEPMPGYLEIDLVAHNGGVASGAFIHSLVVTDVSSGWTEAVPLLAREQSLVVEGLEAISRVFPVPVRGIDSDNDSVFINETLVSYCEHQSIEFTRSRAYRKNDQA